MTPLETAIPPAQQRLLVTLLIGIGALGIAHQAILSPLQQRRAALTAELDMALKRQALLQRVEAASGTLAQLQTRLLPVSKSADLLHTLSSLAAQHDVTIVAVTPQPMERLGAYTRFPVAVHAQGTYRQVAQLLEAIAQHTVPLRVEQIDLTPADEVLGTPTELTTVPLTVRMTVSTLLREG